MPALQPLVRVADLDAAVAVAERAIHDAAQRLERAERELRARRAVLERQCVAPEGHLGQGHVERGAEPVALAHARDGRGRGGDDPAGDVNCTRVRRLGELVFGERHDEKGRLRRMVVGVD